VTRGEVENLKGGRILFVVEFVSGVGGGVDFVYV
jgi:hypothetical protein